MKPNFLSTILRQTTTKSVSLCLDLITLWYFYYNNFVFQVKEFEDGELVESEVENTAVDQSNNG